VCEDCFHGAPHLPGCPNAPPARGGLFCGVCRDPIEVGYEYAEIGNVFVCGECISDMSGREILALCGFPMLTAEREENDFGCF
jgi:hypothetical protein